MEYSVQELSRISGVTPRTLRWYDEIGLLKPSRVAETGYRYYGPEEVDRLQHILFYRSLGVKLSEIRKCLDAPGFSRLAALKGHLAALEAQQERLGGLIRSVRTTIEMEERNEMMNDAEKFEAFKRSAVEANEARYGKEIREKYGDAEVDAANAAVMNITPAQYQEWTQLGMEIQQRIEVAVQARLAPDGEEGRTVFELHKRWISLSTGRYDANMHRGIAAMYICDERFTAYYDKNLPGCAQFLRDAVHAWAK